MSENLQFSDFFYFGKLMELYWLRNYLKNCLFNNNSVLILQTVGNLVKLIISTVMQQSTYIHIRVHPHICTLHLYDVIKLNLKKMPNSYIC